MRNELEKLQFFQTIRMRFGVLLLLSLNFTIALAQRPFITEWNTGTTTSITIPTTGSGYSYDVYWEEIGNPSNNGTVTGQSGSTTIGGLTSNKDYRIEIKGTFPRIYFNNIGDTAKIKRITQWGDIAWSSFSGAFYGCSNLDVTASDTPILSSVTSLFSMFRSCTSFTGSGANWNWHVSSVANMS